MEGAKRARKAETPKQPSLHLRLRAPQFYPDPDKLREIESALEEGGFHGLTEMSGRGKQRGITIGEMKYDKLPKELMMIVCSDNEVGEISAIIEKSGRTGNIGDGKIFVMGVEDEITIRTGEHGEI